MWCADQFLTLLKSSGYCAIRLPKADIQPLQVLTKRRIELDRLGDLSDLLVTGTSIPLPAITPDSPAPDISGERTSDLSVGVGVSILGTILGAMGGGQLGIDAQFQKAASIAFQFENVIENHIDVIELDKYLGDADVNPASRYVARLLEVDAIYVVTSTIKSNTIKVDAKDSAGQSIGVSIPAIEGIVGGNVKVSHDTDASSMVRFQGETPLVFGFQAVQLFYRRGRYTAFRPLRPEEGAMRSIDAPEESTDVEILASDGPFLRLDDGGGF
jgi:hypothetical protein